MAATTALKTVLNPMDPTFLLSMASVFGVLFVEADDTLKSLNFKIPSVIEVFNYVVSPAFLIAGVVLILALLGAKKSTLNLTRGESLVANWFLWNAVVFHTLIDGLGGLGILPLMNRNLRLLDRRFNADLVGMTVPQGPSAIDRAGLEVLIYTEVLAMTPLCLLAFFGVCHRSSWRQPVQATALALQWFGAVVFLVPDLLTGCENFQPQGESTCTPPFTPFFIFYTYIGIASNFIWIVVPILFIVQVVRSDVDESEAVQRGTDGSTDVDAVAQPLVNYSLGERTSV